MPLNHKIDSFKIILFINEYNYDKYAFDANGPSSI